MEESNLFIIHFKSLSFVLIIINADLASVGVRFHLIFILLVFNFEALKNIIIYVSFLII